MGNGIIAVCALLLSIYTLVSGLLRVRWALNERADFLRWAEADRAAQAAFYVALELTDEAQPAQLETAYELQAIANNLWRQHRVKFGYIGDKHD